MTPEGFRAFRYNRGMPQAELARALGVSRNLISEIEQGRSVPSRQLLLAMSAYVAGLTPYEVDPADLRAFMAKHPLRVNRSDPAPIPGTSSMALATVRSISAKLL